MIARCGLSSASAPELSASDLAALTRRAGGTVVDLRAGRGHRWERDGIAGLAGLPVAFVGLSVVLGRDDRDVMPAEHFPDHPVKIFAAVGALEAPCTSEQIDRLTRHRPPRDVLIETHRGHAGPDELMRLCDRYGCRLLIDNLGLHGISRDFEADLTRLALLARAVQVKGFGCGDRHRHRPLTGDDLRWLRLAGDDVTDLTVESHAGVPEQDLSVLRHAWKGVACDSP
ncbi:hypothetical protein ACWDLG_36620 [Nonomuraea sp. NPDC003727]